MFRKCTTEQCNEDMTCIWQDLSTAEIALTATLKTQKSFLLWIPLTEDDEGRVSSLCSPCAQAGTARILQKRSPDPFWRVAADTMRETKPLVENVAIKVAQSSKRACWLEEDQIFSSSKKDAWKSYEIFSVTAYSLFLLVIFLTRTDLSDLSLEKYMQLLLFC